MNGKLVLGLILISLIIVGSFIYFQAQAKPHYTLNVQIMPSMTDMSQGETNKLVAYNLNGTEPYSYAWSFFESSNVSESGNLTVFSLSNPAYFTLNQTIAYIGFQCTVTDANGMTGYASQVITDMAAFTISGGIYPGAPTYTVWGDSAGYYAKDANGNIDYSGTNATTIIQDVLIPNVTVIFESGNYIVNTLSFVNKAYSTTTVPQLYLIGYGMVTFTYSGTDDYALLDLSASQGVEVENIVFQVLTGYSYSPCVLIGGGAPGQCGFDYFINDRFYSSSKYAVIDLMDLDFWQNCLFHQDTTPNGICYSGARLASDFPNINSVASGGFVNGAGTKRTLTSCSFEGISTNGQECWIKQAGAYIYDCCSSEGGITYGELCSIHLEGNTEQSTICWRTDGEPVYGAILGAAITYTGTTLGSYTLSADATGNVIFQSFQANTQNYIVYGYSIFQINFAQINPIFPDPGIYLGGGSVSGIQGNFLGNITLASSSYLTNSLLYCLYFSGASNLRAGAKVFCQAVGVENYAENGKQIGNSFTTSTPYQIGWIGSTGTPSASTTYTCYGNGLSLFVNGGTGVAITIDQESVPYNSSGSSYHLTPGETINFGSFSSAPNIYVFVADG
jgi:hypothetical protein